MPNLWVIESLFERLRSKDFWSRPNGTTGWSRFSTLSGACVCASFQAPGAERRCQHRLISSPGRRDSGARRSRRQRRSSFRYHPHNAGFGPLTSQSSTVVSHHERESRMARRTLTVDRYEEIKRRLTEGRSLREIAAALGRIGSAIGTAVPLIELRPHRAATQLSKQNSLSCDIVGHAKASRVVQGAGSTAFLPRRGLLSFTNREFSGLERFPATSRDTQACTYGSRPCTCIPCN